MSNKETLFELWLDGELTKEQAALFESLQNEDDQLKRSVESARAIHHQAACFEDYDVPEWDRAAMFDEHKKPWWQWQLMPAISLGFSLFAVVMVMFKVEVQFQDDGLMISFADSKRKQQQVEMLVDSKLKEFAGEQQVILANYMTDLTQNQQDVNMQLAGYVLEATRQERKQDMSDFVRYVNDLRSEDKLNDKIKFQQLESKITNIKPSYIKTSLTDSASASGKEK